MLSYSPTVTASENKTQLTKLSNFIDEAGKEMKKLRAANNKD